MARLGRVEVGRPDAVHGLRGGTNATLLHRQTTQQKGEYRAESKRANDDRDSVHAPKAGPLISICFPPDLPNDRRPHCARPRTLGHNLNSARDHPDHTEPDSTIKTPTART